MKTLLEARSMNINDRRINDYKLGVNLDSVVDPNPNAKTVKFKIFETELVTY